MFKLQKSVLILLAISLILCSYSIENIDNLGEGLADNTSTTLKIGNTSYLQKSKLILKEKKVISPPNISIIDSLEERLNSNESKAVDTYKIYTKLVNELKTLDYGAISLYGEKVKILAVSEEKVKNVVSKLELEDYVIIEKVKHSKKKLDAIQNIIGKLMPKYEEITSVGVNPMENCVDVTVTEYSEELKKRFNNIDSEIIQVTVSQAVNDFIA